MNEFLACPDPEVLAAFIDGRLSGDRRRAVVEHLDACEDCYAVFSEAVRFQGEEEPRGRVIRTGRFYSRRWIWPAVAAAAVLVVLVAVPILRMSPSRPVVATLPAGGELRVSAATLVSSLHVDDVSALDAALRHAEPAGGLGFAPERLDRDSASFRTGTWLVTLHSAVRAQDAAAAEAAVLALQDVLTAAGVAGELQAPLDAALEAAREKRLADLAHTVASIEERADALLEPFPLFLGEWAEAGRLAAAVGDAEYFASPVFVETVDRIAEQKAAPERTREAVTEIRELVRSGATGENLEELQERFKVLIAQY